MGIVLMDSVLLRAKFSAFGVLSFSLRLGVNWTLDMKGINPSAAYRRTIATLTGSFLPQNQRPEAAGGLQEC